MTTTHTNPTQSASLPMQTVSRPPGQRTPCGAPHHSCTDTESASQILSGCSRHNGRREVSANHTIPPSVPPVVPIRGTLVWSGKCGRGWWKHARVVADAEWEGLEGLGRYAHPVMYEGEVVATGYVFEGEVMELRIERGELDVTQDVKFRDLMRIKRLLIEAAKEE